MEHFRIFHALGRKTRTVPDSRRIFMGLESDAAGGLDICADANQYIDLQQCLEILKGDLFTLRQTIFL